MPKLCRLNPISHCPIYLMVIVINKTNDISVVMAKGVSLIFKCVELSIVLVSIATIIVLRKREKYLLTKKVK